MAENDRLETLIQKMQEALSWPEFISGKYTQALKDCRAVLRQAIAELPLIRDEYERKIAELEGIIANAEQGENQ